MQVEKRNLEKEIVKFDKITERLKHLLYGGLDKVVDAAIITQKVAVRVHDGIKTKEIDELTAQVCVAMVTVHPAFGTLAGRIVIDNHQKNTETSFLDVVKILRDNVGSIGNKAPLVSEEVYTVTMKYENEIQDAINFERDHLLGYFGFKTLENSSIVC